MKSEELQGLGLTKEQIDKVFELNGKDVNSAKEANKAEVDDLKTQLSTLMEQVKKFDGVDPSELTKQISDLM